MKRSLLVIVVVGLLAGQAFAGLSTFTLNKDAALMLTEVSHSPAGSSPTILSQLLLVTTDPDSYSGDTGMQGQVGYMGLLDATASNKNAWMRIGATTATSHQVGEVIGTALGTDDTTSLVGYGRYNLFLANDNNSNWQVRLFITAAGTTRDSGFVTVTPGENRTLSLDLAGLNLSQVTGIGFDIGAPMTGGVNPSDPDIFHVSAVPIPAGVLLGFLGLSAAGLGLRKLA